MLSGRHLGYCEGELCRIEGAVGAEYIEGTKMRYPLGGAYGRTLDGTLRRRIGASEGLRQGMKGLDIGGGGPRANCIELLIVEHGYNSSEAVQ
jgi:hypothetical protein